MSTTTASRWRLIDVAFVLLPIVSLVFCAWVIRDLATPDPAKVRACDRAVSALLSTHDAVEFDRAKYLIRHLDCSLRRRLPP